MRALLSAARVAARAAARAPCPSHLSRAASAAAAGPTGRPPRGVAAVRALPRNPSPFDGEWAAAATGESLSDSEETEAPHAREEERALASAAASLARRPHSRAELARKLRRRGFDAAPAAAALDRLSALGLQDDADYAASFARAKWRANAWAPDRIERELVSGKGVALADARAAVERVFGADRGAALKRKGAWAGEEDDGDEVDAKPASIFDEPPPTARELTSRLLDAARSRAAATRGLAPDARRRRLVGWLARRGHGWSTISAVLAALEL